MVYSDDMIEREITKDLMNAIQKYKLFDSRLFGINFIVPGLTNSQVIKRLEKAVKNKTPIERSDKTFFIRNYLNS